MRSWATGRFDAPGGGGAGARRWSGPGQQTALLCRGPRVAWLSAPDRPTLDRLVTAVGSP
jgi:hypothetical protein